jgi:predicted nucleic acid-binding protein
MVASAFVDTNILLRALNSQMDQHIHTNALIQQMWDDETDLWISSQVIREFLVQVTHPNTLKPPLAIEQVMRRMEVITTLFRVADDTPAVTAHLLILLKAYPTRGKQVHDANIVATMLANGIDTLLTLNVDDFNRFKDRIKIVSLAR